MVYVLISKVEMEKIVNENVLKARSGSDHEFVGRGKACATSELGFFWTMKRKREDFYFKLFKWLAGKLGALLDLNVVILKSGMVFRCQSDAVYV